LTTIDDVGQHEKVAESQGGARNAGPVIHVTTMLARPPLHCCPRVQVHGEFDEKSRYCGQGNADFERRVFVGSRGTSLRMTAEITKGMKTAWHELDLCL
jgi:hypothetical protein